MLSLLCRTKMRIFSSEYVFAILEGALRVQERPRTCHLPIVLLQFMDLAPFAPIFLVDVNLVVVRTQRHL